MGTFLRRLRARFKYRHFERDLSEEIQTHREHAERDARASGFAPHDADVRATRRLGNVTLAREEARAVWIARWVEHLIQDVRYAVRGLRRTPVVTLAATAVLVAAMGLTTSLFTTLNAVLLRPWPVADAERVASAFAARGTAATTYGGFPAAEARYLREHSKTSDVVIMRDERVAFDFQAVGADAPVRVASDNYFSTLGIGIQRGRGFQAGDDSLGSPRAVVVLSDDIWRTGYGAREDVIGQTVAINNVPFMVVGIANAGAIDNPLDPVPAAFLPFGALELIGGGKSQRDLLTSPTACCQDVALRLNAGVSLARAAAEIEGLSRQFRAANNNRFIGVRVTGTALIDTPRANTATPIFGLLLAAVLMVLALACANVGNILLARSMARLTEVRVRLSLGASRARVIRQFLTESLVLSGAAAALSLPIAYWLPGRILGEVSPRLAHSLNTRPDPTVFAFVAIVMALAAALFGLAPALRVTSSAVRLAASTRAGADRGTARLRLALLAGQITIGGVLLVASMLMSRAVTHATNIPLGFATAPISVAKISLPRNAYDLPRAEALTTALLGGTSDGVSTAASSSVAPLESGRFSRNVRRPDEQAQDNRTADWTEVSPSFFDVAGIPIVAGAPITQALGRDDAVINQSLAKQLWQTESVVGRTFITSNGQNFRVAAVAQDARLATLDDVLPTVFRVGVSDAPLDVSPSTLTVLLRGASAESRLRSTAATLDARVQITVRPMQRYVDDQLKPTQVGASIAGALGVLAAIVSAIGVFGVFSYLVSSREREIGIRLALGASASRIVTAILRTALVAVAIGLSVGLLAAIASVPVLRQYLYGMSPFDPSAFGAAAGILALAACVATIGPLRKALRVNPAVTLKAD